MTVARQRLRLGISRCLLGEDVRYDGGNKHDPYLVDRLGPWVEWVPVCPEFEAGLGVPREPMELRGNLDAPRLMGRESGRDFTAALEDASGRRVNEFAALTLDGFILKTRSPSCGLVGIPVSEDNEATGHGPGLFTRLLQTADRDLPLCDENELRLEEPRRHFLLRTASRRLARQIEEEAPGRDPARRWTEFFEAHDLACLAREVDPREVEWKADSREDLAQSRSRLAAVLARNETVAGKVRALEIGIQRLEGLDPRHWFALAPMLQEVRDGTLLPQVLRVTLHLIARSQGADGVSDQLYLQPMLLELPVSKARARA